MKKLRSLLVTLAAVLAVYLGLVCVVRGQQDDGTCDSPGNPYICGNCTWWVWKRAHEVNGNAWASDKLDNLGDAHQWDNNAPLFGLDFGDTPYPGAIAVWERINPNKPCDYNPNDPQWWEGCGHVAYVESVEGTANHGFRVSEMNYPDFNVVRIADLNTNSRGENVDFIYPPSDTPVPLWPYNGRRIEREDPVVLRWYGTSDLYYIWYNIYYDDGDEDGGIVVDIQGKEHPLSLPRSAWVTWLLCGYDAGGGNEVCANLHVFYAGPCPEPGAQVREISALTNTEDYCGPDYYPTPIPTSTPFPTPTPAPRPTATPEPPPTNTPTPGPDRRQCQNEAKTGVYLYAGKNYEGACAYFTESHPNLGNTPVEDNAASSIRINGEYQVRLFEHTDYGGRYEEVNASESDLDWRSLGGQFSSIELHATTHCTDEGLTGVYLYSGKNFTGDCAYFVTSHPNLGETAVGDNRASSVRINGEYRVRLFKDVDYGGVYEEINQTEADLSWRSLYGQFSSVELHATTHCEDENQPGIYLYSSKDYGGDCAYFIEDCSNLPLMPVSIRIIGPFWARIYGKVNYAGPYDEFHEGEPNMDWRSLGRQWRSMEVFVDIPPTQTPVPTATALATATPLPTATPTGTATKTTTSTPTNTATRAPTRTSTPTRTPSPSPSPSPTSTSMLTPTPTAVPGQPRLDLNKILLEPVNGVATVGETVRFKIIISNTGDVDIATLPLTDVYSGTCLSYLTANPLPDGVTYSEKYQRHMVLWYNLGRLDVGQGLRLTVDFRAEVPCPAAVNRAGVTQAVDAYGNPVPPRLAEVSVAILATTATPTPTSTATPTGTPSPSPTRRPTATATPTVSPTTTKTATKTSTPSRTPTRTPSPTLTPTPTETATSTPTRTPTNTPLPGELRQASDLRFSPENPLVGQGVHFWFVVRNAGELPIAFAEMGPWGYGPNHTYWEANRHQGTGLVGGSSITINSYQTFSEPGVWTVAGIHYQLLNDSEPRNYYELPNNGFAAVGMEILVVSPTPTATPEKFRIFLPWVRKG